MTELGVITTPDGTVYRLCGDMSWSVSHRGVALPDSARRLEALYEDFQDFPAVPGQRRLQDLAEHAEGHAVWLMPPGDPTVIY